MKKVLLSFAILVSLVAAGIAWDEVEQKYKVESSIASWQRKIDILESAKQAIKQSDIPAKVALPLADSLTAFENEIIAQVSAQAKPKTDSTNKK